MHSKEFGPAWYVSPWNFPARDVEGPKIIVHDTTLRDGEQQAGVAFSIEQKIEIAAALDAMGVDRIEAGMVAVSEDDRQAVRRIAAAKSRAEIWTVVRSLPTDVDMAVDCGVSGTGVILLGNEQYCRIFGWTLDAAIEKALACGEKARTAGLKTTLLIADSPRLSVDHLRLIVERATASASFGALALMDTFGTLSPVGVKGLVEFVRSMTALPIEFHGHNDFGLGVANSLEAMRAGAEIIHTSVLGLGERVGNTSLEETILAAKILYGAQSPVDLGQLNSVARLVQRITGIALAPHKPVVGEAITHIESGTVASEFLRWSGMEDAPMQWLFAYLPSLVGGPPVELVLGKGSGLANIDFALKRTGLGETPPEKKRAILDIVKAEGARRRRTLSDEEFLAIIARA
jgi:isopropylmalate/homocitrate/citramalate synthase